MATVRQRDVSMGVSGQDDMKESVALAVRKSGPRGQWEDGSPHEVYGRTWLSQVLTSLVDLSLRAVLN